jgi:hypothetical protein
VLGRIGSSSKGAYRLELNDSGIAAIQNWIDDADANFGIMLQDYDASDGVDFYSSEHSTVARRPKLVINYGMPSQT